MGGKEASRGFLYQGSASVLEALTDKNKWDKIYIEFPTSNDKVDIALGAANKVIKSIIAFFIKSPNILYNKIN